MHTSQKTRSSFSGVQLPASMRLDPDTANQMFNRNGFLIHGDNTRADHSASDGCIVLNRTARDAIANSNDHCLQVVP
jgi:hypothetical protein